MSIFIYFYAFVSRRLVIYTYAQCAAVRTHWLLMREPPQKLLPLIIRSTCHGNWPRYAVWRLVIRYSCSFRGTWTFPVNSATHITAV